MRERLGFITSTHFDRRKRLIFPLESALIFLNNDMKGKREEKISAVGGSHRSAWGAAVLLMQFPRPCCCWLRSPRSQQANNIKYGSIHRERERGGGVCATLPKWYNFSHMWYHRLIQVCLTWRAVPLESNGRKWNRCLHRRRAGWVSSSPRSDCPTRTNGETLQRRAQTLSAPWLSSWSACGHSSRNERLCVTPSR